MKKKIIRVLTYILKSRVLECEARFQTQQANESDMLNISYMLFRLIYICSVTLKKEKVWIIFLVDKEANIYTSIDLIPRVRITHSFWLTRKHFMFIENQVIFLPNHEHKRLKLFFFILGK